MSAALRLLAALAIALALALVHLVLSAEPALELVPAGSLPPAPAVDWKALEPRLVGDLQALLRLQTVRGGERAAAEFLSGLLAAEGVTARVLDIEGAPDRAALVAELPGETDADGLILSGHLDVVEADAAEWSHPPFEGALVDGRIRGRGAIDMKGMVTMELHAFLAVKRAGLRLKRPLMLLFVPDEESGSDHGMSEILRRHGDLFARYTDAIQEGGVGTRDVAVKGATLFNLQHAEKGMVWVRARARGPSGHGSTPPPRYAQKDLVAFLADVQAMEQGLTIGDEAAGFFRALAEPSPFPNSFFLARVRHPLVQRILEGRVRENRHLHAMTTNTRTITGLATPPGGPNVVASGAEAVLDIRTLPGVDPQAYVDRLRAVGRPHGVEIDLIHARAASRSPVDSEVFRTFGAVARRAVPGATVAPFMSPGGTDSAILRAAGKRSYGLIPVVLTAADVDGIHGRDENISVENLVLGTRVVFETVAALNR